MGMQKFFRGLSDIFNTGETGSAGAYLRACLAEADAQGDRSAAVTILNEMIGYFRSLGDYPEAIAASERAMREMSAMGHADSPDFGTTLLNAATAFRAAGHKDRALGLYEKAASIYEVSLPEDDPRLAGLRNNLSQLYLEDGRAEEARDLLRLALKALARREDMRLETATVYTNLALALFSLKEEDEAGAMLRASLDIFESEGEPSSRRAPHYAAALAALAEAHCRMGAFDEAAGVYALALNHLKGYFGESRDYAVTLRNRSIALEKAGKREEAMVCAQQAEEILCKLKGTGMTGLELARAYYETHGRDMIREKFAAYAERVAVGLAGQGSECFGFDDALSRDHDFGPCFCMWLTAEDFTRMGHALQKAYAALPGAFMGFAPRREGAHSGGRVGVISIDDFYRLYTGQPDGELSPAQWLRVPESYLATATNGEVFYDRLGEFTRIRNKLLAFYPEDVRLKKIAARAACMAQAGQYNYPRCLRRHEPVAAALALAEFMNSAMSIIFLLNKKYMPFYKWAHRALRALPALGTEAHTLLAGLGCDVYAEDATDSPQGDLRKKKTSKGEIIEHICRLVAERLRAEGLSDERDDFMAAHAESITRRIQDGWIKNLPLTEG